MEPAAKGRTEVSVVLRAIRKEPLSLADGAIGATKARRRTDGELLRRRRELLLLAGGGGTRKDRAQKRGRGDSSE